MSDGRKNNGNKGHSTKAKGHDKRTNPSKALLLQYIEEEFDYGKLKKVLNKLYSDSLTGDTKSTSLLLAYILGKPKESRDITSGGEIIRTIINLGNGEDPKGKGGTDA